MSRAALAGLGRVGRATARVLVDRGMGYRLLIDAREAEARFLAQHGS